MKLTLILTLLTMLQMQAAVYSQNSIFNISVENQEIRYVLNELEQQSNFRFFYSEDFQLLNKRVKLTATNASMQSILDRLLENSQLTYRIFENKLVVIVPSNDIKQGIKVTGTITDANGSPLPGVNIVEKGTNHGAVTDLDGNYAITVSSEDAVLSFSFIGYLTEEIPVSGKTTIDVVLIEDIKSLEEVVVIGYGTLRKSEITGSYATVKGESLQNPAFSSLDQSLQGKATGLQVSSSSGSPGAPQRILVRGTNSISAGTDPLWIIDGIPVFSDPNGIGGSGISPLATINPNDIESVEILKDAAATSIYGSRGSNGVILVITKSGKGKNRIDINYSRGVSELTRTMDDFNLADRDLWIDYQDLVLTNSGIAEMWEPWRTLDKMPGEEGVESPASGSYRRELAYQVNTDWWEALIRNGTFDEMNVSISNVFDTGNIYFSLNYRDEKGVVLNNDMKRYSGRLNATIKPFKNFQVTAKISGSKLTKYHIRNGAESINNSKQLGFGQLVMNTYDFMPIYDVSHPTGYWYPVQSGNVFAQVDRDLRLDKRDQYRGIGVLSVKYSIPGVKGLSLKGDCGFDIFYYAQNLWENRAIDIDGVGTAADISRLRKNLNFNVLLDYNRQFDDHSLTAVVGFEAQRSNQDTRILRGYNLQGLYKQFGRPLSVQYAGAFLNGLEEYLLAYLGRANYSFKSKYLFGVSLRYDGSSKFSPENRWQVFPAFSAGWIVSNEKFLDGLNSSLNFLKLRGSYGKTGNQNLPSGTIDDIVSNSRKYGNIERNGEYGSTIKNVASPNVTWETTDNYDVGLDFGFFNDRVQGSLGYFYQDVNDLILQVSTIPSSGIPDIWFNVGRMINKGFEFNINASLISSSSFNWKVDFNITSNKNRIKSLTPELDEAGEGTIQNDIFYLQSGLPLGNFYLPEWAGIDSENGYDLVYARDEVIWSDSYKTVYELDEDGNPVKLPSTTFNNDNNNFIQEGKSSLPTYFGGFGTSLSYNDVDLGLNFVFSGGNYIYNGVNENYFYIHHGMGRVSSDLLGNMWENPGDNAKYPKQMFANRFNAQQFETDFDRWLEKGDFVRLRNVSLGYTLPSNISRKLSIDRLRVSLSASNLFTFTKYSGWDPELAKVDGEAQDQNIGQGVINNYPTIPSLKSYVLGVNLTF